MAQVLMRSATLATPCDRNVPVVAVYAAVRGLGLLSAAAGVVAAPERCEETIRALLATTTVDQRLDHLLLGAAAGRAHDVATPRLQRGGAAPAGAAPGADATRAAKEGLPPTCLDPARGYPLQGLHALTRVQETALRLYRTETPQLPHGLDAVLVQATPDSNMRPVSHMVDALAGSAPFDRSFTAAVKRELARRGGQFERLRAMRAAGEIETYKRRRARCIIQNAGLFPLHQFEVPESPLSIILGPARLGEQALEAHMRANVATRPADWQSRSIDETLAFR